MMKRYSNIILCLTFFLVLNSTCMANPLERIISFFQKDLVINVLYKNHGNLIQGSQVYLSDTPEVQDTLIGKVNKVERLDSNMSKVEISIDKKYKNEIYEATPFVLVSDFFSTNSNAYIVAVSSETSNKTPLKSGSTIEGISFVEYKIASAGSSLKMIVENLISQNEKIMRQLEEYFENFNTESFQKKMDELIDQISKFSENQKETFKKEILPELRKKIDSIIKQLEEQNNKEKSKDMEKQLQKIEDLVDV